MWNIKTWALLSLIGVMLIWPNVSTKSFTPGLKTTGGSSLSQVSAAGVSLEGEERHRVMKRSAVSCDSTFDHYCLNNGKCMLLVDLNEHHCNCERGFYGPRCNTPEFVVQPLAEEQIIIIIFCLILLLIGLSGALYFCCKWSKRSRFSRQQSYKGVQGV